MTEKPIVSVTMAIFLTWILMFFFAIKLRRMGESLDRIEQRLEQCKP